MGSNKLPKTAIIIGAGIGGMATANLLAKSGIKVTVYEKNDSPGGRAGLLEIDGFRFDTGPSWYLMPEIFEHYYNLLGEDINNHLDLIKLKPGYKVTFDSGKSLTIYGDEKRDGQTFESIEKGSANQLSKYLKKAEMIYNLATKYFLYNNFDSTRNIIRSEIIKSGSQLMSNVGKSVDKNLNAYFKDENLRKLLEYHSVFLGTSPYKAPAIYSLMSHLDFNQGVYYPQGGLYEVIKSLHDIGNKFGVKYINNSPISKIITTNAVATGVQLESGVQVNSDIIISNADLHYTETKLLNKELQTYPESYWKKRIAGPSAILMYLGIKGKLPDFEHHNLFFDNDWHKSFADIFDRQVWPKPASMYVCNPSKTDPSVAPKGFENMFILVPGPSKANISDSEMSELADIYIDQLATMSNVKDLKNRIVVKKLFGPSDFESKFNSWNGTALGLSHTLRQSAIFRPKNKSKKVSNLYYVGANSIPGIGLPMCLIGAELIMKRLQNDKSSGPMNNLASLK